MTTLKPLLWALLFGLLMLVSTDPAMADTVQPDAKFDGLLQLIQQKSTDWNAALLGYAETLFASLALIQIVMTFMPLLFRQADLGEIVGELVRTVLTLGFFFALMKYSMTWGTAVVDSFREAGAQASGFDKALQPSDIFTVGVELANTIGNVTTYNPLTAMMIALSCVLVELCFAFIAAFIAVTLIESYIVINASVLLLGFGGSSYTRDWAMAMPRYAIAVGAKLFVLTLLIGLSVQSAKEWAAAYNSTDNASMWTMIGLSFALAYMAKTVPEIVSGLIAGTSMGGGNAIGGMTAAAVGTAAGIAATAATAGAAAPAAAGAAGGGSGLAMSLGSSMANGTGSAGVTTGTAGAVTGVGMSTGGGGTATAARTGGGISSGTATGTNGDSPGTPATAKTGGKPTSEKAGASAGAIESGANDNVGKAAMKIGSTLTRGAAAISLPGAEHVAPSSAPGMMASETGKEDPLRGSDLAADEVPENIIRPATSHAPAPGTLAGIQVPGMVNPTPEGGAA